MAGGNSNREKATIKKTDSRNKPVHTKTHPESVEHQVRFEPQRFNSLIYDKGYEVYIDRALRCPCTVKGTGQALISCNNCLGIGWIFVNRIETRMAVQQLNANVKYENWSQTTTGMAKVTSRAIDKLAFMDRIILREVEGYFNEVIRVKDYKGNKVGFAIYEILEIESIYLFQGDKQALLPIKKSDYTIDGFKIIFDPQYNSMDDINISIRYRHCLTFHLIDMNRDIMKVRTVDCGMPDEQLRNMPISGIARKSHYIFDNQKYEQENRLIENSTEPE
jgi:hypothetical protein